MTGRLSGLFRIPDLVSLKSGGNSIPARLFPGEGETVRLLLPDGETVPVSREELPEMMKGVLLPKGGLRVRVKRIRGESGSRIEVRPERPQKSGKPAFPARAALLPATFRTPFSLPSGLSGLVASFLESPESVTADTVKAVLDAFEGEGEESAAPLKTAIKEQVASGERLFIPLPELGNGEIRGGSLEISPEGQKGEARTGLFAAVELDLSSCGRLRAEARLFEDALSIRILVETRDGEACVRPHLEDLGERLSSLGYRLSALELTVMQEKGPEAPPSSGIRVVI